jgi:hypothetical protein
MVLGIYQVNSTREPLGMSFIGTFSNFLILITRIFYSKQVLFRNIDERGITENFGHNLCLA